MTNIKVRNPGIDALRGISIVLVVLFHVKIRFPILKSDLADYLPHRLLNALTTAGFEGVFLFFVISGFLITKHTLRRHGTLAAIDLRNFYVRRASRILPFLLLLVTVLSILHLCGVPKFTIDTEKQSLLGAVFSALFLHLNWYEASTGYLPGAWDVMWSLSIEEVFYIGFPLSCVVLRKPWLLAISFFVLALSLPATRAAIDDWMWMSKAYLPGMGAIAMGVVAAMLAHRIQPPRWICLTLQWGGALGIATGIGFSDVLWPWLGHGTMLLLTTSTALSLIGMDAVHQHHSVRPLPGLGWLRSFGRLSYEIYLTHMFVVFGVHGLVMATLGKNLPLGYLWYLPTLLLSWIPGYLIYQYYTGPTDRYLRTTWLSQRSTETLESAS
jgi:peptidoglycan/LPS O-acetylase OafA/YrhL